MHEKPQKNIEYITSLLQEVANFSDHHARDTAEALVQALLDMYGAGLTRILVLTEQNEASGHELVKLFAGDDLLQALFFVHGIHPSPIETRITEALAKLRLQLNAHGKDIELRKLADGIAYLRVHGSKQGCPSSTEALKRTIEEVIYAAAPDLEEVRIEGLGNDATTKGIPVTFFPGKRMQKDVPVQRESLS